MTARPALPEGFTLRPPVDADGEPLVRMINEEAVALIGVPVANLEWVVKPWTAPGASREHDFAVVVAPGGDVAGYLSLEGHPPFTRPFAIGIVGVPYHGRGVGAVLVAEAERRAGRFVALAPPGERVVLRAGALAGEPHVTRLLSAHGYVEVRRFIQMQIDFDGPPPPAAGVPGVEIRPPARGEMPAVYECLADAFADHWGETWPTEEAWVHETVDSGDTDLGLWLLAWRGATLAAVLVAERRSAEDPELGYVAQLGVRREFRRRGIAEALLRTSFGRLHACGARGACLHVDAESITGATRLYERVGMTAQPRFASWEKELRPGREPAPV